MDRIYTASRGRLRPTRARFVLAACSRASGVKQVGGESGPVESKVLYRAVSDMDLAGHYRETQLVLEEDEVYSRRDGRITARFSLDDLRSAHLSLIHI